MKKGPAFPSGDIGERSAGPRVVAALLKIGAFFIILEPVWMLLPFAGFLYGSVMHIGFLNRSPYTSWMVHFVFPPHTLFPLGLVLICAGLLIFLAGAFQVYSAKLLRRGLVKTGIYKKFRHPQYLALTLLGAGVLLTWGRFIAFIAFFVMMWLYFFLSRDEERRCLELFGGEYEDYRRKTYFLFPGERAVIAIGGRLPMIRPRWAAIAASFLLVVGLSVGGGFLIKGLRSELRNTIPVMEGALALSDDGRKTVRLLMAKGPVMQASPFQEGRDRFMEKAFEMLTSSLAIRRALSQFDLGEADTLLVFLTPGSNWRGGPRRKYETVRVNAFILVLRTPVAFTGSNFREFRKNWRILKLIRVQEMRHGRAEAGQAPAEGVLVVSGPPFRMTNESFQSAMEERIRFFLSGM